MSQPPGEADDRAQPRSGSGVGRIGVIALLLGASVLLSRVLGLLRESVLAGYVGAGPVTDAYNVAFLPAELLNYLLAGGALSVAFMPLYSRMRAERGEEAALRLFSTVLGTLGALTLLGTALLWWHAPTLIGTFFPRFDPETRELTVRLARIVMPAQIFFITGGVLRAVLMAHDRFRAQAAAPILYNGAIIAGGIATGTIDGFAWGVLVGAALGNWAYPLWELRGVQRIRVRVAPLHADFRAYAWVAVPLMLGVSLTTMGEWFEKFVGGGLAPATVAYLAYARRYAMAPVGVLGQAVGAAVLPTFSRLFAEGREDELDRTMLQTLRVTVGLGGLAAGACVALAQPVIALAYHHGEFTVYDVTRVSVLFAWMALGVPSWVMQQVGVRAFYARGDTWRPMLLGSVVVLCALPVYAGLARWFGAEGIAVASVVSMTVNAVLVLVWARLRFGGPALLPLLDSALRAAVVAAVAALAARQVQWGGFSKSEALLDLAVGGGVFAALALAGVFTVGDAPTRAAVRQHLARVAVRLRGGGRGPA